MDGEELNVLAVAILGGASLVGGIGSMGGVLLGMLFLAMLQNGLNLLGVSSYFFGVVIGLAILVSICMTGYAENYVRRRRAKQDGVMVASRRRSSAPAVAVSTAELDRVLAGIRRGMFRAGGLFVLLAALVTLFSLLMPAIFPRIDDAAGDDVPAARAWACCRWLWRSR